MGMDEVEEGLFIGGAQDAQNYDLLQKHGITHVLNCAKNLSNFFPEEFVYSNLPLLDCPTEGINEYFQAGNE